jgi:hypothetical protein
MPGLKHVPFKFAHCYALLEHKLIELEDVEEDDVLETKKNMDKRSDGCKATKEKTKRQGVAASLSLKIDVMIKSKEALMMKTLAVKKEMMEAKARERLREDAKRKADIEEKRACAEEHHAMAELIAAENATMLMNPAAMDEETLEWWKLTKTQILARRREAARADMAAAMTAGGGDATAAAAMLMRRQATLKRDHFPLS